ncbi:MAG: hypothetical protein KGH62_04275, partial [Candidatus Micrarchaeota archaeon]|nr:hypothetical protein [Candidatus Micrarchaeota archaeon]
EGMEINLTGVAIGTVAKKNILRRDGVRKGDVVCVTGSLGKNGAGYYMWKKTGLRRWAELLLDIEPRIDEGVLIAKSGATAAIDLSDGLFSAILQLSKINRCGFEIDYPKVPIHYAAKSAGISTGVNVEDIALNFGGDYELLFTIQKSKLNHLLSEAKKNGIRVSVIGKVAGRKCMLVKDGKKVGIRKAGYEHFR